MRFVTTCHMHEDLSSNHDPQQTRQPPRRELNAEEQGTIPRHDDDPYIQTAPSNAETSTSHMKRRWRNFEAKQRQYEPDSFDHSEWPRDWQRATPKRTDHFTKPTQSSSADKQRKQEKKILGWKAVVTANCFRWSEERTSKNSVFQFFYIDYEETRRHCLTWSEERTSKNSVFQFFYIDYEETRRHCLTWSEERTSKNSVV